MSFEDKSIECSDCNAAFVFTAQEQEAFQTRGYTNAPKRCPTCRQARKERQASSGYVNERSSFSGGSSNFGARRQMFPATCAQCGKQTQVPFEPREGRPVYCSTCYNSVRASR